MDFQPWFPIAGAILGGGAAGAIITAIVTSFRNRVQPVGLRVVAREMFRSAKKPGHTDVKVLISDGANKHEYANLHEVAVDVFNSGNVDRESFKFGLTLGAGQRVVLIEPSTQDRHHQFVSLADVSPANESAELDFEVTPFNRGDAYSLILYVTSEHGAMHGRDIVFSSPSPVKFVAAPEVSELMLGVLKSAAIFPGGFTGRYTSELLKQIDRKRQ